MSKFQYTALLLAFLATACSQSGTSPVSEETQTLQQGYALINTGKPEQAILLFDKVLAQSPDDAAAYNGKGVAFDHTGNHLAAQDLYKHALSVEPESLAIRNNLAMSLILGGQLDEAISLLDELSRQYPENKTVRQNLALAYGLKGAKNQSLALNLQDLPPEQAQENLRFYASYAHLMKKLKTTDAPAPDQIGFATSSADGVSGLSAVPKAAHPTPKVPQATPNAPEKAPESTPQAAETAPAEAEKPAPTPPESTPEPAPTPMLAPEKPAETTEKMPVQPSIAAPASTENNADNTSVKTETSPDTAINMPPSKKTKAQKRHKTTPTPSESTPEPTPQPTPVTPDDSETTAYPGQPHAVPRHIE